MTTQRKTPFVSACTKEIGQQIWYTGGISQLNIPLNRTEFHPVQDNTKKWFDGSFHRGALPNAEIVKRQNTRIGTQRFYPEKSKWTNPYSRVVAGKVTAVQSLNSKQCRAFRGPPPVYAGFVKTKA